MKLSGPGINVVAEETPSRRIVRKSPSRFENQCPMRTVGLKISVHFDFEVQLPSEYPTSEDAQILYGTLLLSENAISYFI